MKNKWSLSLLFLLCSTFIFADENPIKWGWLPQNINNAPYAHETDQLYLNTMYIVLAIFFLTEGCLLYFIIRYRYRKDRQAAYVHGNNKAEFIWTVIPGFILLWLALSQIGVTNEIREKFPDEDKSVVVQGFPRQFEWWFRYQGADKKFGTDDDIMTNGQLWLPVNKNVITKLSAKDVIHSFFLPQVRIKQDAVPGILTKVWFNLGRIACWNLKTQEMELLTESEFNSKKVIVGSQDSIDPLDVFDLKSTLVAGREKTGQKTFRYEKRQSIDKVRICYQGQIKVVPLVEVEKEYILHRLDVACAELCGAEHYRMRGVLVVVPEFLFKEWLNFRSGISVSKAEQWRDIWDKYHPEFN